MAEGVLRRGRGITKDMNSKGMFINSDSEPPVKADLQVEVSFRPVAMSKRPLKFTAESLVIRVEPATSAGVRHGFAILNKSYKLYDGRSAIDDNDIAR
jgi:hypothetical protein